MLRPERSTYTAIDFIDWRNADGLEVTPKFQRRSVWSQAARSYLIDTLLLGMPVPAGSGVNDFVETRPIVWVDPLLEGQRVELCAGEASLVGETWTDAQDAPRAFVSHNHHQPCDITHTLPPHRYDPGGSVPTLATRGE